MPLLHKGRARQLEEEGPAQGGRRLLVQPRDEPGKRQAGAYLDGCEGER
jgi:hypothetical protein